MRITLKDGSVKEYEGSRSVLDIAKDISEGLARAATSAKVNGDIVDLRKEISEDCELELLTFDSEDGKGAFWHTTSHIMAQAVKRLYPETKLAIGPSIDNGFYYDLDRETPFVAEDLEKIVKNNPISFVFVDQAYFGFEYDPIDINYFINKYDNIMFSRTFSKFFALAGLRLGYGIASKRAMKAL